MSFKTTSIRTGKDTPELRLCALLCALLAALAPLAAGAEQAAPPRFDLDCDRVLAVQVRPYLGQFAVFVQLPQRVDEAFRAFSNAHWGEQGEITVRGQSLFSYEVAERSLHGSTAFLFPSGERAMMVGQSICADKLQFADPVWLWKAPPLPGQEEPEFELNCDRVLMVHVLGVMARPALFLEVPGEVAREYLHHCELHKGRSGWITANGTRLFKKLLNYQSISGFISFDFATMDEARSVGEKICSRKLNLGELYLLDRHTHQRIHDLLRQRETQQLLPSPYQGARLLH